MVIRRLITSERGLGLIENMVSISIMALVIASATSTMVVTFHGNAAARSYAGIVSDVQGLIDGYRHAPYVNLLNKFNTSYLSIAHNQTATESIINRESHAQYNMTYTAIKRSAASVPDAVKVRILVEHNLGNFGSADYTFETVVAQSG